MTDETNTMPDAELARKLQAKTIVGNVRKHVPSLGDDGKPTGEVAPLFEIYGQASSTKRGEGDNGPWVALLGRFEAINITTSEKDGVKTVDGRYFSGPQCFLPEPVSSMIATQLEATEDEKNAAGEIVMQDGKPKQRRLVDSVEFAFQIGVKATETPVGYEYTVKPLIKAGGADPLADLRKRVSADRPNRLSLPAPEKTADATVAAKTPAQAAGKNKR